MPTLRPARIHSQHNAGATRARTRHIPSSMCSAPAGWWLSRMVVQANELDALIVDLERQRRRLPADGRRPWRAPSWLEASLPLSLVREEYDAIIQVLTARRADLGRTYLPLMHAVNTGQPAPVAVTSIIAAW